MSGDAKSWTFVYVADMQPGSPRSYRFRPAWAENWQTARRLIVSLKPEFLLIGGDVTRDGSIHTWELEAMKASFDGMGIPYRVIPGNMDILLFVCSVGSGRADSAFVQGYLPFRLGAGGQD